MIKNWQVLATSNLDQVRTWWRVRPDANVGLATGPDSDLYVIDVDQHDDVNGEKTLEKAQRRLGALPPSVEQRTGGGGRQIFFRFPHGHKCRNTAGKHGVGPGIDTRGDGGFVVVPPSIHPSGTPYTWVRGPHEVELAALPADWITKVERRDPPRLRVPLAIPKNWNGNEHRSVREAYDRIAHAGPGERNSTLNGAAYHLAKLANAGLVEWQEARAALETAGRTAGLQDREITKTIMSATRAVGRRP